MKALYILLIAVAFTNSAVAQITNKSKKVKSTSTVQQAPRKIVMQLTTADTTSHKMLLKQLTNILSVAPETKIEVVCHGPGLAFLHAQKSIVSQQIGSEKLATVDFAACRFSMTERKVSPEELVPQARIVEAGIIEIVDKQMLGWSYIKAGN
jgi:intracellular sulfur oxidation DsrE/DsrF family protein